MMNAFQKTSPLRFSRWAIACLVLVGTSAALHAFDGPVAQSRKTVRYAWKADQSGDGKYVAASYGHWNEIGEIVIFDASSGDVRHRIALPSGSRALATVPDADGKPTDRFVAGDFRGNYYEHEFATGKLLRTWRQPRGSVECLSFSSDGKKLIAGSNGDFVVVWDFKTAAPVAGYHGHPGNICSAVMSPDQRFLASGDEFGNVYIADAATNTVTHKLRHPPIDWPETRTCYIGGVLFSPDSQILYSVGIDGFLRSWDAATGESIASFDGESLQYAMAMSDDGELAVLKRLGGLVRCDADLQPTQTPPVVMAKEIESRVSAMSLTWGLRWIADNQCLSASWDRKIRRWDVATGEIVQTYDPAPKIEPQNRIVSLVAFDDDKTVATIATGGTTQGYDAATLQPTDTWQIAVPSERQKTDPAWIDRVVRVDDHIWVRTEKSQWFHGTREQVKNSQVFQPIAMKFLPKDLIDVRGKRGLDGVEFWVATDDGTVSVYRESDGQKLQQFSTAETSTMMAAHFAPDLRSIAWMTQKGVMLTQDFTNSPSGLPTLNFGTVDNEVFALPNGSLLISAGGDDSRILTWDKNQFRGTEVNGQTTATLALEGGKTLITCSNEGLLQRFETIAPPLPPSAIYRGQDATEQWRAIARRDGHWIVITKDGKFLTLSKDLRDIESSTSWYNRGLCSATYDPGRDVYWVGSFGGDLVSIDAKTGERRQPIDLMVAGRGHVDAIVLSADGQRIACGLRNGAVVMAQASTGQIDLMSMLGPMPVKDIAWSNDGKYLAVCFGDMANDSQAGYVHIIDTVDGSSKVRLTDHQASVDVIAFTTDGQSLITAGQDQRVLTYAMSEITKAANEKLVPKPIAEMRMSSAVKALQPIAPNRCVVTCYGGEVAIIDSVRQRIVKETLGHVQSAPTTERPNPAKPFPNHIGFDLETRSIVTADMNGEMYQWQLESEEEE